MKVFAFALAILLCVSAALASEYGWHEPPPKVIKIIKHVPVIKVVEKHIPPPVPVIKYIKLYHSTHVGHPYGGHHHW